MLNGGKALRKGELLSLEWPDADLQLLERQGGYWVVSLEDPAVSMEEILREGAMPVPPYVLKARRRRGMPTELADLDRERYQTVYARAPGAIAAPTAGLHFTKDLLAALEAKGVLVRPLTLLVGPGTFRPVKTERAEDHVLEPEFYHLPADTALEVGRALSEGRRVIATGTTCCRVLEYVARKAHWQEHGGWTDLYIYPPFEFRVVRALITNFHLPRSTLLMLVCAFAGLERVLDAYRVAIEQKYRFYSYGDAMFIY
jgi:S-adenosylmethionine:tRNA ribosyltransferase-isomerase